MKLVYLTVGGNATTESTKLRERFIEMPDGYHPVTNDSVWQDAKRRRDPMLFIIQGVRAPYGGTMAEKDVSLLLYEMELRERAFKPNSVSKMWWRALLRLFGAIKNSLPMIIIGGIIALVLYDEFVKGGT